MKKKVNISVIVLSLFLSFTQVVGATQLTEERYQSTMKELSARGFIDNSGIRVAGFCALVRTKVQTGLNLPEFCREFKRLNEISNDFVSPQKLQSYDWKVPASKSGVVKNTKGIPAVVKKPVVSKTAVTTSQLRRTEQRLIKLEKSNRDLLNGNWILKKKIDGVLSDIAANGEESADTKKQLLELSRAVDEKISASDSRVSGIAIIVDETQKSVLKQDGQIGDVLDIANEAYNLAEEAKIIALPYGNQFVLDNLGNDWAVWHAEYSKRIYFWLLISLVWIVFVVQPFKFLLTRNKAVKQPKPKKVKVAVDKVVHEKPAANNGSNVDLASRIRSGNRKKSA